jgi:mRNA-degrading endonuclease HigB of HigAB toxin-antitoxin module
MSIRLAIRSKLLSLRVRSAAKLLMVGHMGSPAQIYANALAFLETWLVNLPDSARTTPLYVPVNGEVIKLTPLQLFQHVHDMTPIGQCMLEAIDKVLEEKSWKRAHELKQQLREIVARIDGVVGVGGDEIRLIVYLQDGAAAVGVPNRFNGVPIEKIVMGEIKAEVNE